MSRGRYKKAVESLGKRIGEHRFKQRMAGSPELFHYYEKEIGKFERERLKKKKRA